MTESSLVQSRKMHFISKTPFSKLITPYQKYQNQLHDNTYYLTKKFPMQSASKIKQMLQQLNNNVQMVEDLLKEQTPNLQDVQKPQLPNKKLSLNEENNLLKRSFLNLFKKLKEKQQTIRQYQQKNKKLSKQNQFFKIDNKYLRQSQQLNSQFKNNLDIF